jgi:peptide deformylase
VVVEGLNRHGEKYTLEGTGLLAARLQHEVDHLNSCLFVDRLAGISRDLILRKVKKLSKAGKW